MKKTYETGIRGEQKAAEWLIHNKGMTLLEHRYKNSAGEIDLIMLDADTVVFVEVKTRLNAEPGTGMLAVDHRKQQRIAKAAFLFLGTKRWHNRPVRFDVAEICGENVFHIPDAFQPGGMFFA